MAGDVAETSLVEDFFSENGKLKEIGAIKFKCRYAQKEMARLVESALFEDKRKAIEAPTGVGKSFAYLVPAIYFSKKANEKVVIATDTNTLLDQLGRKDAVEISALMERTYPFIRSSGIRIVSIRGKGNYLCLKRMEEFMADGGSDYAGMTRAKRKRLAENLTRFRMESAYWERNDLDGDAKVIEEVWDKICIPKESDCSPQSCPRRLHECRYYSKLMADVAKADVILTNHSLLLSDANVRREKEMSMGDDAWTKEKCVLPPYKRLIVDEAHKLSDNCENALSKRFSFREVERSIRSLVPRSGRDGSGLLIRLNEASEADFGARQAHESVEKAAQMASRFDEFKKDFLRFAQGARASQSGGANDGIDLTDGFPDRGCASSAKAFLDSIRSFALSFNPKSSDANKDELFAAQTAVDNIISQSAVLDIILEKRMTQGDPPMPYVCVMPFPVAPRRDLASIGEDALFPRSSFMAARPGSADLKEADIRIEASPVFSGKTLDGLLYSKMSSLVLTSATLDADDSFSFFREFSGLSASLSAEDCVKLPHVFDYASNMLEICVKGFDSRNGNDPEEISKAARFIAESINAAGGRTLCLFSSYEALDKVRRHIEDNGLLDGSLELLCQRKGSVTSDLVDRFRKEVRSSLMATSSFWEGVDFPGETLQLLIMHKIPFASISVKMQEQKRFLDSLGQDISSGVRKNHFNDVYVPQAIIKMRQGVGRLLRSETDRGVAVFLDSGLYAKSYGRRMRESLRMGDADLSILEIPQALESIRGFFGSDGSARRV